MVAVQCMAHRAQPPYDLHKDLATKPTSKHIGPLEEKSVIGSHLYRKNTPWLIVLSDGLATIRMRKWLEKEELKEKFERKRKINLYLIRNEHRISVK